jgi:hypothetical protein
MVLSFTISFAPKGIDEFLRENPVSMGNICRHVDFSASSLCEKQITHGTKQTVKHRTLITNPSLSNLNSGTCVPLSHTNERLRKAFVSVFVDAPKYLMQILLFPPRLEETKEDCVERDDTAASYCLPSLVIVGAQKAGTTSLMSWLGRHPQIRVPLFEQHFFDKSDSKSWKSYLYQNDFLLSPSELAHGVVTMEKTPNYIFFLRAAKNMRVLMPDTNLVLVLRNPVNRAYSAWQHHCRQLRYAFDEDGFFIKRVETGTGSKDLECNARNFETYLVKSRDNLGTLPIVQRGMYSNQLRMWLNEGFTSSQFLILFFETIRQDPFDAMRSIERLADVSHYPYRSEARRNKRGFWTIPGIPTKSDMRDGYESMSDASRDLLSSYYRGANAELLELLISHIWADGITIDSFPVDWSL